LRHDVVSFTPGCVRIVARNALLGKPTPNVPYSLVGPRTDFGAGREFSIYNLQLQPADPD